jgi:hypothetical protein
LGDFGDLAPLHGEDVTHTQDTSWRPQTGHLVLTQLQWIPPLHAAFFLLLGLGGLQLYVQLQTMEDSIS